MFIKNRNHLFYQITPASFNISYLLLKVLEKFCMWITYSRKCWTLSRWNNHWNLGIHYFYSDFFLFSSFFVFSSLIIFFSRRFSSLSPATRVWRTYLGGRDRRAPPLLAPAPVSSAATNITTTAAIITTITGQNCENNSLSHLDKFMIWL